jgi:L-cysteine/cystine lyase
VLGPFHDVIRKESIKILSSLRRSAARLLGARPEEIALVDNTTAGVNLAAAGMEWNRGDEVLVSDLEHPGGYLPWLVWRGRRDIRVNLLQTGNSDEDLLKNLATSLGPRTRAVSISHVAWLTGRRLPVRKISRLCKKAGTLLIVDGAQSVGQIPVDVKKLGVDVYTISGQKWLMGPQGTGAVFVRQALRRKISEAAAGYRSARIKRLETLTFKPRADAGRFEVSTISPALFSGLGVAIDICQKSGLRFIERRIAKLADQFLNTLRECEGTVVLSPPGPAQSGLVSFRIKNLSAEEALRILLKKDSIVLRAVDSNPPSLRASIHYLNSEREIDRIGKAVAMLANKRRSERKRN